MRTITFTKALPCVNRCERDFKVGSVNRYQQDAELRNVSLYSIVVAFDRGNNRKTFLLIVRARNFREARENNTGKLKLEI